MPLVFNFPAGILFQSQLNDVNFLTLERYPAIDPDNRRPLESGRNRPVEVLLPGDVDFADDFTVEQHGDFDRDIDSLLVDRKGRVVVQFVSAGGFLIDAVDDLLLGLGFHQSRAVIFTHFRQGRAHVAQRFRLVFFGILPRRAAAEKFLLGLNLVVNFQPALESQRLKIYVLQAPASVQCKSLLHLCSVR